MAYSKIRQPKLSDVIEQQLEFLILEGTLRPGEKLPPERELAKQFDVSRPSLREAIQRLEAKGLLLRRQGGGTFVQSRLWQSFSDPLVELLSDHPESHQRYRFAVLFQYATANVIDVFIRKLLSGFFDFRISLTGNAAKGVFLLRCH